MFTSPLFGFAIAFALMIALYWIFRGSKRKPMAVRFRKLQVVSAAFMAFAHGSNDAQKTMGIITLALFSAGLIAEFVVPTWVIIVSATALSLGTAVGGWRIMHTMGQRVAKLEPVHGFAAETTAASILLVDRRTRDAGLDDPGHLERDHGRRLQPGRPRTSAGASPGASSSPGSSPSRPPA